MRATLRMILLLTPLVLITACFEEDSCDPTYLYCDDQAETCTPAPASCSHSLPTSATLVIRVSNPLPVLVRVYRGTNYEDGTLIWSGAPQGNSWSLTLPLNDYSATALYVTNGDTTLTVDGDEVTYLTDDTCDGSCYSGDDGEVDLRREN